MSCYTSASLVGIFDMIRMLGAMGVRYVSVHPHVRGEHSARLTRDAAAFQNSVVGEVGVRDRAGWFREEHRHAGRLRHGADKTSSVRGKVPLQEGSHRSSASVREALSSNVLSSRSWGRAA